MNSSTLVLCLIAVFLSGMSGLTYEILWQRQMFLVFGASAPATTAVLTAIFLGIAFGSGLAAPLLRRSRNPLMAFAAMEAMIAVWGAGVPFVLAGANRIYVAAAHSLGEQNPLLDVVRFGLSVIALLPATLCMGATIPVMVSAISREKQSRVSIVYGINTLGAVCGGLATGLYLIRQLGMSETRFVAVALNVAAVVMGVFAGRAFTLRDADPRQAAVPRISAIPRGLGAMYFAAGYVALGLEVVWLRLLGIVNTNSTVTFSLTLAVYLLAMGLGSLLLFPLLRRFLTAMTIFSVGNGAVAASALLTFGVVYAAPFINHQRIAVRAAEGTLILSDIYRAEAQIIFMLIFLPAMFMGMIYPAVCHALEGDRRQAEQWVSWAYFLGTLGSVCGILTVSMFIVPSLGLHGTFAVLVGISAVLCALSSWATPNVGLFRWLATGLSLLLVGGAASIALEARPVLRENTARRVGDSWSEFSVTNPRKKNSDLRRFKAGASATVIIKKEINSDDHLVYVDDQLVASTNVGAKVDSLMLAHLPLLLHPAPANELTVGFGSGGTSYAITTHGLDAFCVEIEPEVPRAADLLRTQNFGVLNNPRFHLIVNDARDHLGIGTQSYDVIATDVTNLQYKQNGSLYAVEYFELMKRKLREGGIACAWIPLAAISTGELRILMKGFQQVFPHATLWYMNHTHTNFGILIGTPGELQIDFARLQRGFQTPLIAENMKLIGMTEPLQLIHCLHLDERGYRAFCGDVPLHTDNNPILEFSSPLTFYQYYDTFRDNLDQTLKLRPHDFRPYVINQPPDIDQQWRAHQIASLSFCKVMRHSYDFMACQRQRNRTGAVACLTEAIALAKTGMGALPDDASREQFYNSFFHDADHWLQSQGPTAPQR